MELLSIVDLMQSCNEDATLDIRTNCAKNVTLTWGFMGITHTMRHVTVCIDGVKENRPLTIARMNMNNRGFIRGIHQSKVIMRCRINLRKMYQNNPDLHKQVMKGALS